MKLELLITLSIIILLYPIKSTQPPFFLKSYDAPINISSEGVLALYTLKEQYPYLKNKEILILQSEQGFIDENSNTLNQEELQSFIEKMQKNKEDFKLSSIDRLKKMNLQKLSYEVRISQDGKSIYAKIK
ncbi:hypothetical protein B11399_04700 [Campylobacter jejuni]|nr:hypothetical protein B11399_04700 [Campylobacter jejuni]